MRNELGSPFSRKMRFLRSGFANIANFLKKKVSSSFHRAICSDTKIMRIPGENGGYIGYTVSALVMIPLKIKISYQSVHIRDHCACKKNRKYMLESIILMP